jgi:RimJ/RimL family protein N-acetyltransferase
MRLILRSWQEADRDAFASLHADPEVMRDLGGIFNRERSDAKFDRYTAAFEQHGFTRWAVENPRLGFLGYAGIMLSHAGHPLGAHVDIGWRFRRSCWGYGYATEAATAAMQDAFTRVGLAEILAYTSPDNLRSQAVMARLGLQRDASRDFSISNGSQIWYGLVWCARSHAAHPMRF